MVERPKTVRHALVSSYLFNALDECQPVAAIRQVTGVEERRLEWIGRPELDASATPGPEQDGHQAPSVVLSVLAVHARIERLVQAQQPAQRTARVTGQSAGPEH